MPKKTCTICGQEVLEDTANCLCWYERQESLETTLKKVDNLVSLLEDLQRNLNSTVSDLGVACEELKNQIYDNSN